MTTSPSEVGPLISPLQGLEVNPLTSAPPPPLQMQPQKIPCDLWVPPGSIVSEMFLRDQQAPERSCTVRPNKERSSRSRQPERTQEQPKQGRAGGI